MGDIEQETKLARLEEAGILIRRSLESPLDVLRPPVCQGVGVLEALLEERSEERHEGSR